MKKTCLILFIAVNSLIIAQTKTGCISGNCKDGKGTYVFNDGSIYVGEFVNGIIEGFGKLTDKHGNVYTGYFKNNRYDGIGKFERTDGTKYIGEFKEGRRHGLGTQYYSANYKEKGRWENDRFIEEVKFDEFVIEEPYSFCQAFMTILAASGNNFQKIKGDKINPLIPDEYYSNVLIKELSTVSINEKFGYSGTYFKGELNLANQRFEELNSIVKQCFNEGCYTTQLTTSNNSTEKLYQYLILNAYGACSTDVRGVRVVVKLNIQKNIGTVVLEILTSQ